MKIAMQIRMMASSASASSSPPPALKMILPSFNRQEALKRFADFDAQRIFAPSVNTNLSSSTGGLVPFVRDPLRLVMLPYALLNLSIRQTDYSGSYGIQHSMTIGKQVITYTTWHPTSGCLSGKNMGYCQEKHMQHLWRNRPYHQC